jgi:hypothetical protein
MQMQYSGQPAGGQVFRVNGKVVAELRGEVLVKRVRGSMHLLHHPRRAWAIDAQVLVDAERAGARLVEIVDQETGEVFRAAVAQFHAKGFSVDRGYGAQRALALEHFNTGDMTRPPAAPPVQLAFGW